jgi:hypothetical protein
LFNKILWKKKEATFLSCDTDRIRKQIKGNTASDPISLQMKIKWKVGHRLVESKVIYKPQKIKGINRQTDLHRIF